MRRRAVLLLTTTLAAMVMAVGIAERSAHASTFTVNSTGDAGDATPDGTCDSDPTATVVCTLREAIQEANARPGVDTIKFNIPGTGCNATSGVCTINPSPELPKITDPVVIDGYSQPGTSPAKSSSTAELKIELSGAGPESGDGLRIQAAKSTVRGLVINNWEHGVFLDTGAEGNKVQGNYIGTDASGAAPLGNNIGVAALGAPNNTIGGTKAKARNIISGNGGDGVEVHYQADPDGGGPLTGDPDPATGNSILFNSIYDNDALGIDLIHSNDPPGVTPNDDSPPPDNDAGPNNLQNFPELSSATSSGNKTTIEGTLNSTANTTFIIQFFSSSAPDPSGNGEGQKFLGQKSVTTDGSGNASFTATTPAVPTGQVVTATATNETTGDTSEFSKACQVPAEPCP